jgi:hypothetical protein
MLHVQMQSAAFFANSLCCLHVFASSADCVFVIYICISLSVVVIVVVAACLMHPALQSPIFALGCLRLRIRHLSQFPGESIRLFFFPTPVTSMTTAYSATMRGYMCRCVY